MTQWSARSFLKAFFMFLFAAICISTPIATSAKNVVAITPQVGIEIVPEATGSKTIQSKCSPNYCGFPGYSVYLYWLYPACGVSLDCGTETWYVSGLPSKVAYTIVPVTTTGSNKTLITMVIAADAVSGTTNGIQIGAICSSVTVNCLPATVSLTVALPVPVKWHQVGPGVARPNGVLHFEYAWDSNTGNVADLSKCQVGERVSYPGGSPFAWPRPPYSGSTNNPTILWVPGIDGTGQDNHSHVAFIKPYKMNVFDATQEYRYKCDYPGHVIGPIDFIGWSHINIGRNVHDYTGKGCWGYSVTKTGFSAREKPMPGVPEANCAPGSNASSIENASVNMNTDVSLSVTPPLRSTLSLGEPVFVDLNITNRSQILANLDLGVDKKSNLALTIQGPDGQVITRAFDNSDNSGFGSLGRVTLSPGQATVRRLLLNEWDNFSRVGSYKVKISLVSPSEDAPAAAAKVNLTTEFALEIGPRDPYQLSLIAEQLAVKAISGTNYADSAEAARVLSYIVDPLAVSSLIKVLHHAPLVANYAVQGLGRIHNAQALAALEAAQNDPDADIRDLARNELGALQQPGLKR